MGIATFENTDDRSLFSKMHPQISQDGTWTAYTAKTRATSISHDWVAPLPANWAGEPKGIVWDWSFDNKRLPFKKLPDWSLSQLDVASGRQSLFLRKAGYSLYQAEFAPDGRAVGLIGRDAQ
jgi:hypothetical protein